MPAKSLPSPDGKTAGKRECSRPSRILASPGLMPAALTRTRACPGPGTGAGTSATCSTSTPPYSSNRTAFMAATPSCQQTATVPYLCEMTVEVRGVVVTAHDPAVAGDHEAGDRRMLRADEGERPRTAGQRHCLADHAAVRQRGNPLAGVSGGQPLDRRAHPRRKFGRGLGTRDDVPALLGHHALGDRVSRRYHLAELAALPVTQVDFPQVGLDH